MMKVNGTHVHAVYKNLDVGYYTISVSCRRVCIFPIYLNFQVTYVAI